ncbi:MAG TPA: CAP domain-containing protein [Flavisolibacter sp.]|nr:CAP domain-containing protein [Flavisolibacter sp.]
MFWLPVIFALLSCSKGQLSADSAVNDDNPAPASVNKTTLLQLVNKVRSEGCKCGDTYYAAAPPVTWNNQLETAAQVHSNDMFEKKYFSHVSPDGSNAGDRIEKAGYNWRAYGENIATGYKTEQDVVKGWIGSPTHCKNIMNRNYTEMGVARKGNYWTQEFGRR